MHIHIHEWITSSSCGTYQENKSNLWRFILVRVFIFMVVSLEKNNCYYWGDDCVCIICVYVHSIILIFLARKDREEERQFDKVQFICWCVVRQTLLLLVNIVCIGLDWPRCSPCEQKSFQWKQSIAGFFGTGTFLDEDDCKDYVKEQNGTWCIPNQLAECKPSMEISEYLMISLKINPAINFCCVG